MTISKAPWKGYAWIEILSTDENEKNQKEILGRKSEEVTEAWGRTLSHLFGEILFL